MTIEQNWEEAGDAQHQGPDAWGEMQPIPVVVHATMSENVAPESTAFTTFQIPLAPQTAGTGAGQAQQVCQHAYKRYKAKFLFLVPANTTIYVAKTREALMGGSLATAYQVTVGATAITTSQQLMPDYDGQQPLFMVASQAGASVSVMDEIYKPVQ